MLTYAHVGGLRCVISPSRRYVDTSSDVLRWSAPHSAVRRGLVWQSVSPWRAGTRLATQMFLRRRALTRPSDAQTMVTVFGT